MQTKPLVGFVLSLTTAIMWGALPLFIQLTLRELDSFTITFYRFLFAFLFVLVVVTLRQELPKPRQFTRVTSIVLILAGLGLTANYVANVVGLKLIDAESAQVIIQLAPFLLMLGGVVFFKESFAKIQILGSAILIVGFVLFFYDSLKVLFSGIGQYRTGVLVMLFAAITWVAYALGQKWLSNHFTSKQITLMIYGLGALVLVPMGNLPAINHINLLTAMALLFCCVNTVIAYGAFASALEVWQASKVSAVIALAPIFTILFMTIAVSWFPNYFISSDLTQLAYLGAFLVVIGSMVTALGRGQK